MSHILQKSPESCLGIYFNIPPNSKDLFGVCGIPRITPASEASQQRIKILLTCLVTFLHRASSSVLLKDLFGVSTGSVGMGYLGGVIGSRVPKSEANLIRTLLYTLSTAGQFETPRCLQVLVYKHFKVSGADYGLKTQLNRGTKDPRGHPHCALGLRFQRVFTVKY